MLMPPASPPPRAPRSPAPMRASPLFVPYRRPGEDAAPEEPPTLGHLDDDEDADATPQAEAPGSEADEVPYGDSYGESYGASRGYAYREVGPVDDGLGDNGDALSNVSWNDAASMMSEQSRPPSPAGSVASSLAPPSPALHAARPSAEGPPALELGAAAEGTARHGAAAAAEGAAAAAVRRSAAAKLAEAQDAMRAARERAGSLLQQR
jgi:hypothetical protein